MTKTKKVRTYLGTISMSLLVDVSGVPAKNTQEAGQIMRAIAESCVGAKSNRSVSLWRKRGGTYEDFGRGRPDIRIKYPDVLCGTPITDVDSVDEEDDDRA